LCGLTLGEERFLQHKESLVREILRRLEQCSKNEALLLLKIHKETGAHLTDISDKISEQINKYTYELLDHLDSQPLSNDPSDLLIKCFLDYCLLELKEKFEKELLLEIPDHHKKAIIACHVASQLVYKKGLAWSPSIIDVFPVILRENYHEK
jgi:glutamate dehydrogenase